MYITDEMIDDRAGLAGCTREEFEERSHWRDTAELELEQEHMWQIFSAWDDVLKFLADEPNKEEIAELLLRGWTDDADVWVSEGIAVDGKLYFNQWTISWVDDQWMFERTKPEFFDVELLTGLQVCQDHDNQLENLIESFTSGLTNLQVVRLNQIVRETKKRTLEQVYAVSDRTAVGGQR